MRELIRRVQDHLRLRQLLLDGLASEPAPVADDAYFTALRDRVRSAG